MMKRLSLILLLALLIGAWAVLGASAEAPELEVLYYTPGIWQEDSEDTIEFAVVPEEQDWQVFYHDTFAMRFDVGNYDEMEAEYGGAPSWNVDVVDAAGADIGPEYLDDHAFHLRVWRTPWEEATAHVNVSCNWGEKSWSDDFYLHFVPCEMPAGNNIPSVIDLKRGETTTFEGVDFEPAGYSYVDRLWFVVMNDDGDLDSYIDWQQDEQNPHTLRFTPREDCPAGYYPGRISIVDGNVGSTRELVFRVADEEGRVPDIFPVFNEEASEQDLAFSMPAGHPDWPVFVDTYVTRIRLENYDVITTFYGDDPDWSLSEGAADVYMRVDDDNRSVEIRVNDDDYPDEPVSADFVLKLTANGEELVTRDIHIDFEGGSYPEDIVISPIHNLTTDTYSEYGGVIDLTVGETIEINGAFAPEGYRPNFGEPWIDMGFNDFPGDIDDFLHYECNGTTIHVTALQPGTYVAWIDMRDGNINATTLETVVFRVHDEEGNVPGLDPVFDDEEYTMTMASRVTNPGGLDYWISEGDELFIRPGNQEALIGLYGRDGFEWSFETVEGEHVDMIAVRADDEDDNFDIRINDLSAHQPGTTSVVEATLRCAKGDIAGETTLRITVHFIDLALPNSIQWDAKITMAPGEEYWTGVVVDPSNWHEGFLWYDVFENEWRFERRNGDDELTYMLKCFDNGMYTGACHIHAYNVFINGPDVTYRVTDGQYETLYLPAMLTEIEDSAFEGIAAEAVQIPYGVTSIGSRAFADCPNLMAVYIPGSVGYIADDAFDGSDNVELFWN